MKTLFLIVALLLGSATFSYAQGTPVVTQPKGVISNNGSSTIGNTNQFQIIWNANSNRTACTIQNNGTNNMWVFFGPASSATENGSVLIKPGQPAYCNIGNIVLQDQVSITGTASDVFFAAQQ